VPLAGPAWNDNQFSVSVPTRNGRIYTLQYKNLLTDTHWTAFPLVAGNGEIQPFSDPTATASQRFYRVLSW